MSVTLMVTISVGVILLLIVFWISKDSYDKGYDKGYKRGLRDGCDRSLPQW